MYMLDNVKEYSLNFLQTADKWKMFYILLSIVIFTSLAFYVFKIYIEPKYNNVYLQNKENHSLNPTDNTLIDVYLISVDWCPHCKSLLGKDGVWKEITQKFESEGFNNYRINFYNIDGDNKSEILSFEDKYLKKEKIESYPSIYLIKNNQVIEFDANPDVDKFTNFLKSVLV